MLRSFLKKTPYYLKLFEFMYRKENNLCNNYMLLFSTFSVFFICENSSIFIDATTGFLKLKQLLRKLEARSSGKERSTSIMMKTRNVIYHNGLILRTE